MRTTRARLDGLLRSSGLRRPADLDGWRDLLELCSAVAATVAGYGADIFGADLESLAAATADRRWRKAQGVRLGWWRRRTLVKQARALRIDGVRDTTLLHGTLAAAVDQWRQWRELSTPESVPAALPELADTAMEFDRLRTELAAIAASAALGPQEHRPVHAVDETLQQLAAEQDVLYRMPRLNELTRRFSALGLDPLLDELAARDADTDTAVEVFRWAWLSSVLDELRLSSTHYGRFVGVEHTRAVTEFRAADREHVQTTARRVRRLAAEHLTRSLRDHPDQDQLVRRQASLKRRHLPLRKLVERAPDVLLAARPCWAMSPLVVSRVLPSHRLFDVVVFDEASQVEPADAITSIMRGDQLVVAGDNRQLPPTTSSERRSWRMRRTHPKRTSPRSIRSWTAWPTSSPRRR
ncbi:MAG: AAA domain-containing protein [Pseudonocardiaceae bacterium]